MKKTKPIRIVLAEDHELVRAGIASLLEGESVIEIVAEAGDGKQACELIAKHQPEVAVLDVRMPGLSGLEAIERIVRDFPEVRVVMLSVHDEEEYVLQAMRAGAKGYVLKDATPQELVQAIECVARGQVYLSRAVAGYIAADYARCISAHVPPSQVASPLQQLTPRQREILCLVAHGHGTKEIAARLNISHKTVETHRLQLMERLGIHDVAGLVRYAFQNKLVSLDGG